MTQSLMTHDQLGLEKDTGAGALVTRQFQDVPATRSAAFLPRAYTLTYTDALISNFTSPTYTFCSRGYLYTDGGDA